MGRSRKVALVAVTLALSTAVAVTPSPSSAAVPEDFVGIVADDVFGGLTEYRRAAFAEQAALGIGVIRRTFDWAQIEFRHGHYDWSVYDAFVAAAATHGIRVLPVLFNPPSFHSSRPARNAKRGTYFPKRNSDMGDFGAAVARRYGVNGTLWTERPDVPKVPITAYQVWNEPNLPVYSPPRPKPKRYVKLLKATSSAIKRVDPRAEIVTAGLPDSKLSRPGTLYQWITAMYRAGGKSGFDTLAINPYGTTTNAILKKLAKIRKIMRRFGDRGAKIWVTEIGWSDSGPGSDFRAGAKGQARRITTTIAALERSRSRLGIRGFVYFMWRDGKPYPPNFTDFWGLHTGLLRFNGTKKPAYNAFKRAVARL